MKTEKIDIDFETYLIKLLKGAAEGKGNSNFAKIARRYMLKQTLKNL
jgi:hypothetical protein